ncbi:SUMF1/EgtB/PvdO family nonheme iron enzyme [candidate division KSB1 bacterium]|nr:SUMF1/EgtB/PvdO family nonheme iron enzyme [candidate division KSB1 bacterium]
MVEDFITEFGLLLFIGLFVDDFKRSLVQFFQWFFKSWFRILEVTGLLKLTLFRYKIGLRRSFHPIDPVYRQAGRSRTPYFIHLKISQHVERFEKQSSEKPLESIDALEWLSRRAQKYILLAGPSGSGKTTLIWQLSLHLAHHRQFAEMVPIVISLSELGHQNFETFLTESLKDQGWIFYQYVQNKLKQGKCRLLFDGFDTILQGKRAEVVQGIKDLTGKFSKCQIIITTRLDSLQPMLFPSYFQVYEILELDTELRNQYIRRNVKAAVRPNRLIEQINSEQDLQRLSSRPLNLLMLCQLYQSAPTENLPDNRKLLYERWFNLMCQDRMADNGLFAHENQYSFEFKKEIAGKFALEFLQDYAWRFSHHDLVQKIVPFLNKKFFAQYTADCLIRELTKGNRILRQVDPDEYKFAHSTFQAYFAAEYLATLGLEEQEAIIEKYLLEESWREFFTFYVQCCELPCKIIEKALQIENPWLAGRLALHGIKRLNDDLCTSIFEKILDQVAEKEVWFNPHQYQIIRELTDHGYQICSEKGLQVALQILKQNPDLELKEWDRHFRIVGRENIDQQHPGMVYIPAGEFIYQKNEVLFLPFYWIESRLVSNEIFKPFVLEVGLHSFSERFQEIWEFENKPDRLKHPVRFISWFEAAQFCNWLSRQHHLEPAFDEETNEFCPKQNGYRLPSEQEWEKAAAWDAFQNSARLFPWGDDFNPNNCNNSVWIPTQDTDDVNKFERGRSFFGCYDMAGNVWEWTASSWGPEVKEFRVIRGGSCVDYHTSDFHCTMRRLNLPHLREGFLGFRLARSG